MIPERPSGNNFVWRSEHHDLDTTAVPAADAALHLVATLWYAAGGLVTWRHPGGPAPR